MHHCAGENNDSRHVEEELTKPAIITGYHGCESKATADTHPPAITRKRPTQTARGCSSAEKTSDTFLDVSGALCCTICCTRGAYHKDCSQQERRHDCGKVSASSMGYGGPGNLPAAVHIHPAKNMMLLPAVGSITSGTHTTEHSHHTAPTTKICAFVSAIYSRFPLCTYQCCKRRFVQKT